MKKNHLLIILLPIVVLITSCSNFDSYQNSIYNDNVKISKQGDSYSFKDRLGVIEDNNISLTFNNFSGKQTIWEINAEEQSTFDFEVKIKTSKGEFKVCLISENNDVIIVAEGVFDGTIPINIQKGRSYIAIVGRSTDGEIIGVLNNVENISINKIN